MTGRHRIVLDISPELFGRLQARAVGERRDPDEWVLRTVIVALMKRETATERRAREALRAMASARPAGSPNSQPAVRPKAERGVAHAANI